MLTDPLRLWMKILHLYCFVLYWKADYSEVMEKDLLASVQF